MDGVRLGADDGSLGGEVLDTVDGTRLGVKDGVTDGKILRTVLGGSTLGPSLGIDEGIINIVYYLALKIAHLMEKHLM